MNRIRTLRLARGLTQDELVRSIGGIVTKQALSKYENAKAAPSPKVAAELARALQVKAAELFSPPRYEVRFVAYRIYAGLGVRDRAEIEGLLAEQVSARLALQDRLGVPDGFSLPTVHVGSVEDAEVAAEAVRDKWDLGSDPIGNLIDVLERRRVHVIELVDPPKRFHGISALALDCDGRACGAGVAFRDGTSGERQRLTMAHEVGHLVLDMPPEIEEEKAAFRFGASLLMPAGAMYQALGRRRGSIRLEELGLLKRHFGVSMQALVVRAADLGIIDASLKRDIFMAFSRRGWRKAEPDELPMEQPTLWRQLVSRARAEGVMTAAEAQRWGVGDREAGELAGEAVHGDPRALLARPKAERAALLREQAREAQHLYEPGSELMEWTEEFVEEAPGE